MLYLLPQQYSAASLVKPRLRHRCITAENRLFNRLWYRKVRVGFMVDNVELRQVLLRTHRFPSTLLHATKATTLVYRQVKVKVIPQQAEVAQRVPGRLRPQIFLTFGTTRVVGRQQYAPATFTPGEIPGTRCQRLSRPQSTWFGRGSHGKNRQWHHRDFFFTS